MNGVGMGQGQKMLGGWSGQNDWIAKIWRDLEEGNLFDKLFFDHPLEGRES